MRLSVKVHKPILGQPMLDDRKAISTDAKWNYKYEPLKFLQTKFKL